MTQLVKTQHNDAFLEIQIFASASSIYGTALVQYCECSQVASAQHTSTLQVILRVHALASCSLVSHLPTHMCSYCTTQLQDVEYTQDTHEKLTYILRVPARVLAYWGLARIKISERFQLIIM